MKCKIILILCIAIGIQDIMAQNTNYISNAENLKNTIWLNPKDGFELNNIPDSLKKESAVILSKSYEKELTSLRKFKFLLVTATVSTQNQKIITYHERVILLDKAAIEAYSSISYQKSINRNSNFAFAKFYNQANTYIGAKIIKPDGKEVIVNTSEEVLLKNTTNYQQGKLALPDLQIGDILDFYICSVETKENSTSNRDIEILNNEYRTLNYKFKYTFNSKLFVKYTTANNCPKFNITTDDEGNTSYTIIGQNLEKKTNNWWVSHLRSYPYFELNPERLTGIDKDIFDDSGLKNNIEKIAQSAILKYKNKFSGDKYTIENAFKRGFNTAKKHYEKKLIDAPLDSIFNKMYDYWKFEEFSNLYMYYFDEGYSRISLKSISSDLSKVFALSAFLKLNRITHEILIVSSRYWKKIDEVNNFNDVDFILKVNTEIPSYFYFSRIHNKFNELPIFLRGEDAYSIYQFTKIKDYKVEILKTNIPATKASENITTQDLSVDILEGMEKIKIKKLTTQYGEYKIIDQFSLLDMRLIHKNLQIANESKINLEYFLRAFPKNIKEKYDASFDKDLVIQDEYFTELIKEQYEITPEQVTDKAILKTGLVNPEKELVYTTTFVFPSFIQKAGANYLLNAGKLIGTILPVKPEDRTRTVDIYMPAARELNYKINVNIPKGYKVKGVEQLNKSLSNNCGSFTSNATTDGNVLTLMVSRTYTHNFEKASEWPKLVSLLDVAFDFTNQKVLLEKM
jgi:hypothetical protein